MIVSGLTGVDFVVANTDAQALASSRADRVIQMAFGDGRARRRLKPEVGRAAARRRWRRSAIHLSGAHMAFAPRHGAAARTGAARWSRASRANSQPDRRVVTKPFHFEGARRMRLADGGIADCRSASTR